MAFSYPVLRRLGLGAHLAVIVALAAVPTSLLIIGFVESERREAIAEAKIWAHENVVHGATYYRQQIEAARTVLETAAGLLETAANVAPCDVSAGQWRVVWHISPNGTPSCATDPGFPLSRPVVSQMIDAADESGFAIAGPYRTAPGQLSVFGVLTRETDDGVRWHILRPIEFDWSPGVYDGLNEPDDLVTMALDGKGQVYARVTPFGGLPVDDDTYLNLDAPLPADLSGRAPMTMRDIDGENRIFATSTLPVPNITIMVGVEHDAVLAKAWKELIGSLALFAAVLTVSGVIAWLVIERMILRSVRKLRDAAVSTARGEAAPRVDVSDGPVELRELADAFNDMTDKLEFQALHDQLTGLGNRRFIEKHLKSLVAEGEPFALLAVDLDGFKPINDTYGHATGDLVLAEVARRLKAGLGDGLFIGRTGGDEFLAATRTGPETFAEVASSTARRMLEQLCAPIPLDDGKQVTVAGSVGIAYWGGDGKGADDVVREADAALYKAKETGRNRYVGPGLSGHPTRAA